MSHVPARKIMLAVAAVVTICLGIAAISSDEWLSAEFETEGVEYEVEIGLWIVF